MTATTTTYAGTEAEIKAAELRATHAAVLAGASYATTWQRTESGMVTEVDFHGFTWTVKLPPPTTTTVDGEEVTRCARITARRDRDGDITALDVVATWPQTIDIVEAAMSALRVL